MTNFSELNLLEALQRALAAEGYERPTPIQAKAIPHLLEGRDLFGCAQTGTGKTAAFALPILQRLSDNPRPVGAGKVRALVLAPTRELAGQIHDSFRAYGRHLPLSHAVIYGGVGQNPQVQKLARGVDILVATPGRLLDLMGQGHVRLDRLEVFVLDEADRMLDMGFIHDIRKILAVLPRQRQTLCFSATVPPEIAKLAGSILTDPVKVEVAPVSSTAERIEERVMFVERADKRARLVEVLEDAAITRALVFTRTKHGANRVAEQLRKQRIDAEAIHGNKSQSARQKALDGFRSGRLRILVATDIAARGIDIDDISHVINFDLPNEPETYIHRIGRTARAGATGIALSFCDAEERAYLRDIERLIRRQVPIVGDDVRRGANGASNGARPIAAKREAPPQARRRRRPRRQRAAEQRAGA